jgi:large subunit ribosomal protein L23
MDNTKILIRPIVTEKTEYLKANNSQYTFEVTRKANKSEIKKSVERLFKTKVTAVRVMNYGGKPKRMGIFPGKRSDWKKAIVTLKKGEKIESLER